ncbi:putative Amidase signature domain-containing protein [Seiridium cardinale]
MSKRRRIAPEALPPSIVVPVADSFYLLDEARAVVEPLGGEGKYLPATYLLHSQSAHSKAEADIAINNGCKNDDVWSEHFLQVSLVTKSQSHEASSDSNKVICFLPEDTTLAPGPYILHSSTGYIYSVLKLCSDYNNAFVGGVLRDGPSRYKWLQNSTKIPVPSKLYYGDPTPEFPLKGMRFGVKDAIDIAGLETGNGSKCYRELHPPREATSVCIEKLISAGAVLVGKMRCCQWCDGQDPLERLEEVTPTNPRGDSFQKPSASSSGSAAGCASYDWLDFTIGTDTGGSIRHPAGVNGIYGIRPSLGSMESSGLVCTELMDTPGVFARSATVAEAVSKVMMRDNLESQPVARDEARFKLLYAVDPESSEPTETPKFFSRRGKGLEAGTSAGQIMEKFVQQLEDYLGCKREEVCVYDLWKETHPDGHSDSLVEATGNVYKDIVYGQLSRDVVQPFAREYQERFGKTPFIEESTKARLDYGASVSEADLQGSVQTFKAFAGWINQVLLPQPSNDDEEIPLIVYPQCWGRPQYRDDLARLQNKQVFWNGFSVYSLSYCSGCPDFTLPLGEVEFASRFTGRDEYLPVAISIMCPRNMDGELLRLTRDLENANILRSVECGSRLWGGTW